MKFIKRILHILMEYFWYAVMGYSLIAMILAGPVIQDYLAPLVMFWGALLANMITYYGKAIIEDIAVSAKIDLLESHIDEIREKKSKFETAINNFDDKVIDEMEKMNQ